MFDLKELGMTKDEVLRYGVGSLWAGCQPGVGDGYIPHPELWQLIYIFPGGATVAQLRRIKDDKIVEVCFEDKGVCGHVGCQEKASSFWHVDTIVVGVRDFQRFWQNPTIPQKPLAQDKSYRIAPLVQVTQKDEPFWKRTPHVFVQAANGYDECAMCRKNYGSHTETRETIAQKYKRLLGLDVDEPTYAKSVLSDAELKAIYRQQSSAIRVALPQVAVERPDVFVAAYKAALYQEKKKVHDDRVAESNEDLAMTGKQTLDIYFSSLSLEQLLRLLK